MAEGEEPNDLLPLKFPVVSLSLSPRNLSYSIHNCSSYASSYLPENIMVNNRSDQSSRWSSETNTPPQYITLKLPKPAIVVAIGFGKYEKTHVCNLKKFKVLGSLDDQNYMEVLDSGLKNDTANEQFPLICTVHQQYYPIQYIKIVPLQSWGPSFNYSIWHVSLFGDDDEKRVKVCNTWHHEFKERETVRMCLKHFREQNYQEAFQALQRKTKIRLEDPFLTSFYNLLVRDGDYEEAEEKLMNAMTDGMFSAYINALQPRPVWTPIISPDESFPHVVHPAAPSDSDTGSFDTSGSNNANNDAQQAAGGAAMDIAEPNEPQQGSSSAQVASQGNGQADQPAGTSSRPKRVLANLPSTIAPSRVPPPRGGHQMVIDSVSRTIYLFGGWDGHQDLADLWAYNVEIKQWTLLSANTEIDGGPPPRSCHKMVIDPLHQQLFILGRYVERNVRDSTTIASDFYVLDLRTLTWTQITDDTSEMGGPGLIFDHQMCLDPKERNIYVFGGQFLYFDRSNESHSFAPTDKKYSGMFVYHIPTNTWKCLWKDSELTSDGMEVRSRTGHTMLFNSNDRKLYIFGGQRKKDEHLNDFFTVNVDTMVIEFKLRGDFVGDFVNIPAVGYTQRASIDCARGEIYVMTGLNKDKDKEAAKRDTDSRVSNSFWIYVIESGLWQCVYKNENSCPSYWSAHQYIEPRPRYAHQLVYDDEKEHHYLFGGNPGGREGKEGKLRLGDFWQLRLERPSLSELERRICLDLRCARFHELCMKSPMAALKYLQSDLSDKVDTNSKEEQALLHELPSQLFSQSSPSQRHKIRIEVFKSVLKYFPKDMTQPEGTLSDLVPFSAKKDPPYKSPEIVWN